MTAVEQIDKILYELDVKAPTFAKNIGVIYQRIRDIQDGKTKKISGDVADKIVKKYPQFSISWLLTGQGEMLRDEVKFYEPDGEIPQNKRLIPIYSEFITKGGTNELIPGTSSNGVDEWIDPGDWFKTINGAIRHYGESMIEYPKGCILALKEVQDRRLIVPGKDYVIETSEYRVTKKIQFSNSEYLRVRSTNEEKYDDGSLIYCPFDIPWELVVRIFEVMGYVVKKGSGTIVNTNPK